MLTNIITITLPIFGIAFVGFFYGRAAKPNLSGPTVYIIDHDWQCFGAYDVVVIGCATV